MLFAFSPNIGRSQTLRLQRALLFPQLYALCLVHSDSASRDVITMDLKASAIKAERKPDPAGQSLSVAIGIIGPGLIGGTLLSQLAQQLPALLKPLHMRRCAVVAVANSKRMLLRPDGVELATWREDLDVQAEPLDLDRFTLTVASAALAGCPPGNAPSSAAVPGPACGLVVDCSSSAQLAAAYPTWLGAGLHVVTPNKKAGSGPLSAYRELMATAHRCQRRFMYEATVGAGLPVISTLATLRDTGDRLGRIEGVLSGTLSYIFNTYKPGMRFSDVVADAKARGYTEPDPRDDLSGLDVARKVVILAREAGLDVDLEGVGVESLTPQVLAGESVGVVEFMARLPEYDETLAARAAAAAATGGVLRYVGWVDVEAGRAGITLDSFPACHPFAGLSGADNMLVISSGRYPPPGQLVVRGPGAGAQVTAAGVFGDMLQVIRTHPRG